MSTEIKIKASDGHSFDAWQSEARGEKKGSVVVLHAITGRISHLADVCDQWADNGYTAIAPSLFDRISPNIINSYDPDGVKAGIGHYTSLTEKQILTDIAASSEKLKKKQLDKEIPYKQLPEKDLELYHEAERKEWKSWLMLKRNVN